jgi:hypothetical protein
MKSILFEYPGDFPATIKNKKMKISTEQQRAIEYIKEYGCIIRYEGGFWSFPNAPMAKCSKFYYPKNYIRTNTIKALIKVGLIKVTKEASGYMSRKYPIECKAI